MPKSLIWPMLVTMLAMSLGGCAHDAPDAYDSEDSAGLVVVERSKARPPEWVKLPPGELTETPQDYRVVTSRSKLLNLPLGLKQTQMNGLDAARNTLAALVKAQVLKAAKMTAETLTGEASAAFLRAAEATADAGVGHYGKIADLYYEGVDNHHAAGGDPMAHFYKVAILVTYPKAQLPYLYRDFASRLSRSNEAALRRLSTVSLALSGPVG